jgi:tetratricopeptide (TPR) repeat protein
MWLGLIGFYALVVGTQRSPVADAVFASVALLVVNRPRAWRASTVPLLLVPSGTLPFGPALVSTALLLIGPVAILALIAIVELPFYMWRSSARGMERIASMQVIANPARRCLVVAVAIATLVQYGVGGLAAVALPGIALWRASWSWCVVFSVAASAVTGWSWPGLVLAGICAVVMVWRRTARLPELSHPFPPVRAIEGPTTWLRVRRFERRVRQGDLIGARSILRAARRPSPHDLLRLAFLDVEERSYQTALSLNRAAAAPSRRFDLCRSLLYGRALSGIGRFDSAREIYHELLDESPDWALLDPYVRVLLAENELAAGEMAQARKHAEAVHGSAKDGDDYFLRLRACCVLAECAINDTSDAVGFEARLEAVQNEMLSNRRVAHIALATDQAKLVRELFGSRGSLHQYFVRVDTLSRRADKLDDDTGWEPESVAVAMAIAGWSDDLVELLLTEAHRAARDGKHAIRVRLAARALMELDGTRYRLAAQSSRTSWSRRFQRALAVALDAAHHEQDHTFVAELLEFARVQGLPAATAEASGDLPLSIPPVIRLRGRSRLARPGEPKRPDPVDIETAAERVAGVSGSWLSFWEADDWLYWALVPPNAEIHSGRVSIAPSSDLARDLATLRASLPLLQPEEDLATADFRIARSPLLSDPSVERRLSARLGLHLLPAQLLAAARECARAGRRLSIGIAPSPSLGYVPWGLLATLRDDGGYDRMLDLCDWVLVPSAALVVQAPAGSATRRTPLALAIADTTSAASLGDLPGARSQAAELPASVAVLGGGHWTHDTATIAAFEQKLSQLGPEITVAFLCHAIRGSSDEPSRGGLVMAAATSETEYEILDPASIFAMAARGVEMPAQVLLQACDTSALSDARSGEWLTVAPALLAGGSREVIATLYPVPDIAGVNDPVMQAAVAGESLCDAVARMQRTSLAHWEAGKATELAQTPMYWAGYAPVRVRDVFDREDEFGGNTSQVSGRFAKVMAKAIKECREGRTKQLHSGFLLSAALDEDGIADLFDGATNSLKPATFVWGLGPYICSRFLRFREGHTRELTLDDTLSIKVSKLLIDALSTAREMAFKDGVLVEPEHLLQACLAQKSSSRKILRLLSIVTGRHFELTNRAIAHALAEAISNGQKPPREVTDRALPHERFAWSFGMLGVERPQGTRPAAPTATAGSLAPTRTDASVATVAVAKPADRSHDRTPANAAIARRQTAEHPRLAELEAVSPAVASLFERLADDASYVLEHAIETARELGHAHVGTGHLLLGLLASNGTSASQALAYVGVDVESVRRCVIDRTSSTSAASASMMFSRTAKRTLELALRESLSAHAKRMSSEHVLLALTSQEHSLAGQIMQDLGVTATDVGVALASEAFSMAPNKSPEPNPRFQWELYTERARLVVALAQDRARELNHDRIGTLHLLLGLSDEEKGYAAQVLKSFPISSDQLRDQAIQRIRPTTATLTGRIPFSERVEIALEFAVRESKRLGQPYVGTEHLLLALIDDTNGDAAEALLTLGADTHQLRTRLLSRRALLPRS